MGRGDYIRDPFYSIEEIDYIQINDLGMLIRKCREYKGLVGRHYFGTKSLLSVKLLAEKVGIDKKRLLKFERNQEKPSPEEMVKIQDYLNIPTKQIKRFMPSYPRIAFT